VRWAAPRIGQPTEATTLTVALVWGSRHVPIAQPNQAAFSRYRHWPFRCYFYRQLHLMRTRDDVRIVAAEDDNHRADQREVGGGAYVGHVG
jgi:hypothetical protein